MQQVAIYRHRQFGWTMVLAAAIPLCILIFFGHLASVDSQASRALGPARPLFLIALLVPILVVVLFSSLEVSLDRVALTLRFGPGGLVKKSWALSDLEAARTSRTKISQGWGIHRRGGTTLYNVSGFDAVTITLKDGSSAIIGSNDASRLAAAINRLLGERR